MKVRFYGRLGDVIGRETDVDLPSGRRTVRDLRQVLAQLHPAAADDLASASLRACVGDSIVDEDFEISAAPSVEFFPPLSGG